MKLTKPQDLFSLCKGDALSKRNLFDFIQYSKVKSSTYWSGEEFAIGNTPQQGINWMGELPDVRAVIIKTRPGAYDHDGWSNAEKTIYQYSFKARNSKISYTEKANAVLIQQPQYLYPIFLFTDKKNEWLFEGVFSVCEIQEAYVVLQCGVAARSPVDGSTQYREGGRRYATHLLVERNRDVVALLKNTASWDCEICENNFVDRYGVKYIEAHHKVMLSNYSSEYEVKLEELALLCPNCHKAVHIYMREQSLAYDEIKSILQANTGLLT